LSSKFTAGNAGACGGIDGGELDGDLDALDLFEDEKGNR
jgi:hypothetical protein